MRAEAPTPNASCATCGAPLVVLQHETGLRSVRLDWPTGPRLLSLHQCDPFDILKHRSEVIHERRRSRQPNLVAGDPMPRL